MGEEETHFIKSCTGDMFDVAFTQAIYSHTYNRQKGGGKLSSPGVLFFQQEYVLTDPDSPLGPEFTVTEKDNQQKKHETIA